MVATNPAIQQAKKGMQQARRPRRLDACEQQPVERQRQAVVKPHRLASPLPQRRRVEHNVLDIAQAEFLGQFKEFRMLPG